MNAYGEWIGNAVLAARAAADKGALRRALLIVIASLQNVPDGRLRRLMSAKLAVLPALEAAMEDEAVREGLAVPMEAVRMLGPDVVVSSAEFVDCVVRALTDGQATIYDRMRRRYIVTSVSESVSQFGCPTVVYARDDGSIKIVGDWREHLLAANRNVVLEFLERRYVGLDFNETERQAFASRFEPLSPLERLRCIDELVHASPTWFYNHLLQRFYANDDIRSHMLLPDDVTPFRSYLAAAASDPVEQATDLLDRAPLDVVFDRLSGIPARIPEVVFDRFRALESGERRRLLRVCLRRAKTPVACFHALRLYRLCASERKFRRMLKRVITRVLTPAGEEATEAYLRCVRWFANELFRREECRSWSPAVLLSAAWSHCHQLLTRFVEAGVDFTHVTEILPVRSVVETMAFGDRAFSWSAGHPERVQPASLMLCGLADALGGEASLLDDESRGLLANSFLRLDEYMPCIDSLYTSAQYRPEDFNTYLNGSRATHLRSLIGAYFSDGVAATFDDTFLERVIDERLRDEPRWWAYVAARFHGDASPSEGLVTKLLAVACLEDPMRVLRESDAKGWRLRMDAVSHACVATSDLVLAERAESFWQLCAALVIKDDDAELSDAIALLHSASTLAKTLPNRSLRLGSFINKLQVLSSGQPGLRDLCFGVANILRQRLAAAEVTPALAELILTLRALS